MGDFWGSMGTMGEFKALWRIYEGILGCIGFYYGTMGDFWGSMGTMRDFEAQWRIYEGYMGVSWVLLWYYGVF